MAGLTAAGFERKRLPQIKAEIEAALKAQFGNDIDLRSESVFGQIVGVLALPISELWEEAENIYLAFDPDYAEGVSLDSLAALTGVVRIPATATVVTAVLFGDIGTTIPAGSTARTEETQDIYELASAVTISAGSLARANITINTVQNSTAYTITINGTDYTVNSDSDATEEEILLGFASALAAVDEFVEVNSSNEIVLEQDDPETPFALAVTGNLLIANTARHGTFNAQIKGAKILPAGQLNEIQTTVAGWDAILNPADGVVGRNVETDSQLRLRRRQSVSFPATATVDSLLAKLLQVEDIQAAKVYDNTSDTTDSNGVPPQHIWAIVQGGADNDIAEIIYQTKAGGIGTHGDTTVAYESDSGQEYNIKFERPTDTPVYIDMTIVPKDGYSADVPDSIKAAIVAWVAANISIGDTLTYSRLFTPINSVPGFEVTNLTIGKTDNPTGEVSLTAAIDEILTADTANIDITVDS